MKIFPKIILFISMQLFAVCVQAESVGDTLTHLLLNIHTMQANFSQTVKDQSLKKTLQSSQGVVSLQRPGKFRWDVKTPNPQLIIANDSRLWIYDPDLQQVTIRSFSKATGQTPAFLLSDANLSLAKDFNVEQKNAVSQIANQKIFVLTPKDKDNLFAQIKLTFLKNDIREMQLEDHLGHVTTIAFQHVKAGINLPASLFVFTPGDKVDVIDETKRQ